MNEWWQWLPKKEGDSLGFAVVGIGRFGSAVCRELIRNGADVFIRDIFNIFGIYADMIYSVILALIFLTIF